MKLEEFVTLYSYMEMLLLAPNSGIYTKAGVLTSITYQLVIGTNLKSDYVPELCLGLRRIYLEQIASASKATEWEWKKRNTIENNTGLQSATSSGNFQAQNVAGRLEAEVNGRGWERQ